MVQGIHGDIVQLECAVRDKSSSSVAESWYMQEDIKHDVLCELVI